MICLIAGGVAGVLASSAVRKEVSHLKDIVVAKFDAVHAKLDSILAAVKGK